MYKKPIALLVFASGLFFTSCKKNYYCKCGTKPTWEFYVSDSSKAFEKCYNHWPDENGSTCTFGPLN